MRITELLKETYRRDRLLAWTGWLHLGLFALMLCLAAFDARSVMGVNPWLKPMKFALSITIYVWTIAWLLEHVPGPAGARRVLSGGTALAMLTEIICISVQAGRGTTSHYNVTTACDGMVFSLMGAMILFNTFLAVVLLTLFFLRKPELPSIYLWGIRLGIFVMIMASLEGMVMITHMAHTVGAPDGGPGLPLVNWSTQAGDLRVAHMLGLHALQVFPLVGYFLARARQQLQIKNAMACLLVFVLLYAGVTGFVFWQAINGRPLVAW